jgi:hypothetical protein
LDLSLPLEMLPDGVHSCIISLATGEKIGNLTVIAGDVLAGDLRAEIEQLRAELNLLKTVVRRGLSEPKDAPAPKLLRPDD